VTDFEEVYRRYFGDVHRYLLSLCHDEDLAQELTQETFFKALQKIDTFRGECKLYVWLCQIARNAYLSHLRRERRHEPYDATEGEPTEDRSDGRGGSADAGTDAGSPIEERLVTREDAFAVHRALHALPEPYREVLSLRLFGELPFSQIAELFGRSESWARVTYHRGRTKLKEALG